MAVEDFTTYTLTSPGGTIAVTSTRATTTSFVSRNTLGGVQKDKTAAHFTGDFSHLLTINLTSGMPSGGVLNWWFLSNVTGDENSSRSITSPYMGIFSFDNTSPQNITMRDYRSGTFNDDAWNGLSQSTPYYLKIERVGTALTCKIYDDSGRTNLLHTLAITLASSTAFQYIAICTGNDDAASSGLVSVYAENLDLQEAGAAIKYPQLERGIRGYCRGLAGMN